MSNLNDSTPRKFLAPEILYGIGCRNRSGIYARNLGIRKALLVSDEGVLSAGWAEQVLQHLADAGIETALFTAVTPNPKDYETEAGKNHYIKEGCDGLIVIGGGSPIDCAKAIGVLVENEGKIAEFEGVDTIDNPSPPLICIPTTAGSSADVSQFCIITNTAEKTKMALVSRALVPDVALIDPEVTTTMSRSLTASTGLDALTHATESIVSNARAPLTDLHAREAIALINQHLIPALESPSNLEHRDKMMLASMYAGLAFSNASLGAVHAMAHALGGQLDIPHGMCNSILLPYIVERNFDEATQGYRLMAAAMDIPEKELSDEACKVELIERIRYLQKQTGMDISLTDQGVKQSDITRLAAVAAQDACLLTNPCDLTEKDLETLYARAL